MRKKFVDIVLESNDSNLICNIIIVASLIISLFKCEIFINYEPNRNKQATNRNKHKTKEIKREKEKEREKAGEAHKKQNQVLVRLLSARSATQRQGPGGAKRCVWHPRWLINRAASKLAPRQLRGYFLGNPWNIYARRVAKTERPNDRPPQFVFVQERFEIGERVRNAYRR